MRKVTTPKSYRDTKFSSIDSNKSKVDMVITFDDEATIKMFVEMGFESGTTMSINQLDELLASVGIPSNVHQLFR